MPGTRAYEWTAEDRERRDRVKRLAEELGVKKRELADAAGWDGPAGAMRVSRWFVNYGVPPVDQDIAKIEEFLERVKAQPKATQPEVVGGDEQPSQTVEETLADLTALAGEPEPGERDVLRALAKSHRAAAVGMLVRLMASARSDAVRLKAAELILDRSDGRSIQAVLDLTPKAPVENEQLIDTLKRLLAAARKAAGDGTPTAAG